MNSFRSTEPRGRPRPRPVTRRAFLAAIAAGAAGAMRSATAARTWGWQPLAGDTPTAWTDDRATPPRLISRGADEIAQVDLIAQETRWELAPGKTVTALTYNGQVPGPAIRVREGQLLRVALTNQLAVPTTIHWHGVDVPNPMDGVPDLTQAPVRPGETFVYEFVARPAGTRWYHTHFASTDQLDRGLYASLIIEPETPEPDPPDREYTLVFGAWVTGVGAPVPGPGGMMGRGMNGGMGNGMAGTDRPAYDTFTVNGKAYPATEPLAVRAGERIRLRLINASGHRTHLIYLEGHRLRVTHTDGNPLQQPVEVDVVPVAPSERYDVELMADRPGVWSLHDLLPGQTEAGLRVPVVYAGQAGAAEPPLRTAAGGLRRWSYALGRGVDRLPRPTGTRRTYPLSLSGGMMSADVWTINGRAYPATDPLWVGAGDLVRLRVFNMSMQNHPMHLHGHSFRVTRIGGRTVAAPLIKDVVDVQPMETAELEFVADNPGQWTFHCHKPMHMEGGMVALVRYGSGAG